VCSSDLEYDSFKNEVQILTKEQHAQFVNFEDLVPTDLWGSKDGTTLGEKTELDFMHFQAGGHSLLANEVVKHLIEPKRVAP